MRIGIIGSMQSTEKTYEIYDELKKQNHDSYLTDLAEPFIGRTDEEKERIKIYQKNNLGVIKKFWNFMQDRNAVLVVNLTRKEIENYIGSDTFLEAGFACILNQKIFLYDLVPEIDLYKTEIVAVQSIILNEDLIKIK